MSLYLGTQKVTPTIPAPPSDITLTSLSVEANGTYNAPSLTAYNTVNVNVPAIDPPVSDAVRFFDYDGTILYTYTAAQFLALTEMPANPSHTGLVAQGWNWTLEDAQDYVEEWECLDIGQMYTTTSGASEIDIHLYKGRIEPYLQLAVNGTISVDWGDNSATTSITGTSLTTRIQTQHIYANPGAYTIKINIVSGSFSFYSGSSVYNGPLGANSSTQTENRVYTSAIEAIRIGNGDITIGTYAFYYCTSIDYITIPSTVKIASNGNIFDYCYRLQTVTFPLGDNNFTTIPNFSSCYNLSFVGFSNKITGPFSSNNPFGSCYNIRSITLPKSSSNVYLPAAETLARVFRLIIPAAHIKRIYQSIDITAILNSSSSISSYQFISNIWITGEINIPNSIISIGGYAFQDAKSIQKITIPTNTPDILQNNSVFLNCSSLKYINVPSTITALGSRFCSGCMSLLGPQTIPSGITTIPADCFESTPSLRSVTLADNITSIGNYFLSTGYNAINIILPTSLTTIGTYCFQYCYRFTDITIPSGVTSIGNYSFQYCYGLKEIHMKSTTPPTIGQYTFRSLPADCTIYVPSASLSTYQSTSYWSNFASQMVGE